jgi:hypothetical protein
MGVLGGIVVSIALYLIKKKDRLKPLDGLRVLLAPIAFVVWMMLQQSTAFDAAFPDAEQGVRYVIGVLVAILVVAAAQRLGVAADKSKPEPAPEPPAPGPAPAA